MAWPDGVRTACLLLSLFQVASVQGQQTLCDTSCQAAQQQALVSLYTATGGAHWKATSALGVAPAGWLDTASTSAGLPSHCDWSGASQLEQAVVSTPTVWQFCALGAPMVTGCLSSKQSSSRLAPLQESSAVCPLDCRPGFRS